jgi:hypothetical protein
MFLRSLTAASASMAAIIGLLVFSKSGEGKRAAPFFAPNPAVKSGLLALFPDSMG